MFIEIDKVWMRGTTNYACNYLRHTLFLHPLYCRFRARAYFPSANNPTETLALNVLRARKTFLTRRMTNVSIAIGDQMDARAIAIFDTRPSV